jgi:hypothetical protein
MSNIGKSTNILWHNCPIGQSDRQKLLGQKGCVVWITGLSGSGMYSVDYCLDLLAGYSFFLFLLFFESLVTYSGFYEGFPIIFIKQKHPGAIVATSFQFSLVGCFMLECKILFFSNPPQTHTQQPQQEI